MFHSSTKNPRATTLTKGVFKEAGRAFERQQCWRKLPSAYR
jgi:hypothetical protein